MLSELSLFQSVSFKGDGFLELPANLLDFENDEDPATIALAVLTTQNGVLLYQTEMATALDDYGASDSGDFILLRSELNIPKLLTLGLTSGFTLGSTDSNSDELLNLK